MEKLGTASISTLSSSYRIIFVQFCVRCSTPQIPNCHCTQICGTAIFNSEGGPHKSRCKNDNFSPVKSNLKSKANRQSKWSNRKSKSRFILFRSRSAEKFDTIFSSVMIHRNNSTYEIQSVCIIQHYEIQVDKKETIEAREKRTEFIL